MPLLFTVEDVFTIHHRGIILVPGIIPAVSERFRVGDALRLRRPDGSEVETRIDSIELTSGKAAFPIVVRLAKSEVPIGTEVWLAKAAE